jgi:hypothetical protein
VTAPDLRLPPLGAPGLYWVPPNRLRALTGVRMDVCAFVGVAPRGPSRVPTFAAAWAPTPYGAGSTGPRSIARAVESWDEYVRFYGGFEGPGLLPYAVASFFDNGGTRAYIVRIVHDYVKPDGSTDVARNAERVAVAPVRGLKASAVAGDTEIHLRARDEGRWGNHLSASLSFTVRPLPSVSATFTATGMVFERGMAITSGSLLRLDHGGGSASLTRVAAVWEEWHPDDARVEGHASFHAPVTLPVTRAELVEGSLSVDDGAGRTELHEGLGLSPEHPRWLARVLVEESDLVYPAEDPALDADDPRRDWTERELVLDATLAPYTTAEFLGGDDRYEDIVPDDFFDEEWTVGDEVPGDGVHALTMLDDLSLLVVPDLYSPGPLAPVELVVDAGGASDTFCECIEPAPVDQEPPAAALDGLRLDPTTDLVTIIALQRRLIDLASALESFVVLLDVPPGLTERRILAWRGALPSMYAAAYHPWLLESRADDRRDAAIAVNPSAVAAGIVARREHERGVQYGPANELAAGVFDVSDRVAPARHDTLHQNAINVYLRERDGVRLTAARTLSTDASYRQLSVRRLMTMLRRVLDRQMQWAVFESNDARLRADIRSQIEALLRQLYLADAFAGARAEDAFFVKCDDELNPPSVIDQGRLYAHVGVAPAEPLEFLVLRLARQDNGTVRVEG